MRPAGTFDEFYSQDMAVLRTRFQWVMLILGLVFLFGIFPLIADYYLLSIANFIGITIIGALGLQIVLGYCGQISIGHMAFVAVGGYTTGIITHHLGWSWLLAMPAAVVVTPLVGLIFGLPALRIKGFYLALSTMAAHFILIWIFMHGGTITGAHNGLPVPNADLGFMVIQSEKAYFFLIATLTVLATFLAKNLIRMKLGRALIAVRDNDIAAEFMGINVFRYKMIAFAIASAYAGLAGALYAPYIGNLMPEMFPFMESLWYIGYLIVGGMGSITGVYFGVIFLLLLKQAVLITSPILAAIIPTFTDSILASLLMIFFGLVIALFLIFEPRGLYHRWEIIKSSIRLWPFPY